jgi:hypothetical protein
LILNNQGDGVDASPCRGSSTGLQAGKELHIPGAESFAVINQIGQPLDRV